MNAAIIEKELPNGYLVHAVKNSVSIIDEIWRDGYYERDYSIKKGDVVLDIGANQGFFSLFAASKGARVFAFEPEETNYMILGMNVRRNNLGELITCINAAVGSVSGIIDLFVPDYQLPFASGLVTTHKEFYRKSNAARSYYSKRSLRIQRVRCISLSEILSDICSGPVDLLKIDCEGGELDILKSLTVADIKNISNIVMETHNVYKPRDLYGRMQALNFSVVRYEKPSGLYSTGYLFAANRKCGTGGDSLQTPVVIVDAPHTCLEGESVILSADRSFSRLGETRALTFEWQIDGQSTDRCHAERIGYSFATPGVHSVEVKVTDGDESDTERMYLWVFKKDYFQHRGVVIKKDGKIKATIAGKADYCIRGVDIPADWNVSKIVVGIKVEDPNQEGMYFECNGKPSPFTDYYTPFELLHYPLATDLHFSLVIPSPQQCEISWWIVDDRHIETCQATSEDRQAYLKRDMVLLPECSKPLLHKTGEKTFFVIDRRMLPAYWDVKHVVIQCIVICGPDDVFDFPVTFEQGGEKRSFDYFSEERIVSDTIGEACVFSLDLYGLERTMQIIWWVE